MSEGGPAAGTMWGLGVGPGDPELITLKALKILRAAAVLAYPAPEEGESMARSIVAGHLPGGQHEIAIRMALEPGRFPSDRVYDRAAAEIGAHLEAGRDVAVLCEGDPFFYGSFMYLYARIAGHFPVEVVPGVTSLVACADVLGAPLAARDDVLTVVPATLEEDELRRRLADTDAAAIIKVGRHLAKVRRALEAEGLAGRARYVEHATMASQRVLPLEEVDAAGAPYFSMVLVHRRGEAWR